MITVCLNHWVQDCATWNKSSTADCHWTPVSWCSVCLHWWPPQAPVSSSPGMGHSFILKYFHPLPPHRHIQIFSVGLLHPARLCKPQGRLWEGLDVSWQAWTSLQPTLGWPLSGCETQRMLMGLFSLWWLALNRIGNCQIKQKATNPLSELISRTSTLFCYLSSLSRAAH